MKKTISHFDRGFTSVDFLVLLLMAMMGMTLVAPGIMRTKLALKQVSCESNLRQLTGGWLRYIKDHRGKMVYGAPHKTRGWVKPGAGVNAYKKGKLYKYIKRLDVWHCPTDKRPKERSYSIVAPLHGEKWNYHIIKPKSNWIQAGTNDFNDILKPKNQIVMTEEYDPNSWNMGSWIMCAKESQKYEWIDYVSSVHDLGANYIFADGHTEFWQWLDPDTVYASQTKQFFLTDWNNVDWIKVRNHYRVLKDYPGVPHLIGK